MEKKLAIKALLIPIILIIVIVSAFTMFETVPAGHVKVATLFGKVATSYDEGLHIVNPLYKFHLYDVRQKSLKMEQVGVPSMDQMITNFDVSLQYRVNRAMVASIVNETGTLQQLVQVHMVPKFRSLLREISKSVERAEDFYQKDVQQTVQTSLLEGLREYCAPKGIEVQEVLIRGVQLPTVIREAVERKKRRQQQAEEQKAELTRFKVEQEQKLAQAQAERAAAEEEAKKIKLMADAEAYKIQKLNQAIARNPAYIQLQAIQAMEKISQNPASQVYFINGDSPNPLPLMNLGKK